MQRPRKPAGAFRCFNSSPEIIHIAILMCARLRLSLCNVECLLFNHGTGLTVPRHLIALAKRAFSDMLSGILRSCNSHAAG